MSEPTAQEQAAQTRKLVGSSAYLFLTSIVGGVLGYAYSVAMGRMLRPEEYGLLGALLALVPILSVPMTTVNIAVTRRFSQHLALGEKAAIGALFWRVQTRLLLFGAVGLALFALASVPLQHMLRSPELLPVLFIGLNLFFVLLLPIANGLAQARHRFGFIAMLNVLGPLAKLLGSALFVALGWGVGGAALGLALATGVLAAVGIGYCWRRLDTPWQRPQQVPGLPWRSLLPVFLATLAFNLMFQIDVLLAKSFLDPRHAGFYAAAATLGKAVMYLPSSIVVPLFPMAAAGDTLRHDTAHLLKKAILLTLGLTLAGAVFYLLLAEPVTVLLFGEPYREAARILRFYGFAMVPMALVMVLEHYLLAQGRLLFAYLVFGATPILIGGGWLWRDDPINLVWLMLAVGLAIVAIAAWLMRRRPASSAAAFPQP
ncbi:oligosaccharide flippase family protein [Chitinimonas lacunae]|uniref:Oligosaccharide flippase family protein n=1 Tax=Chitinimonas lacunae TaxID=1963018 RepID=A0ABV8MU63_9NEIS